MGFRPGGNFSKLFGCPLRGSHIMLKKLIFPKPLREFPLQRWVRISVRTWHLMAMGYLLGGVALGTPVNAENPALMHTLLSGLVFSALEVYASGVWFLQLKGQAVLVKMVLLGASFHTAGDPMPWLWAAVVIGGISSHMPGRYRYYSVFHGKVVKE